MKLWDWIIGWVLPLFGELPTNQIDMGQLGTWTIEQMLAVMFWLALGYVLVQTFILMPYRWIRKLCKDRGNKS